MKKWSIALALCCSLICSPASAKTFVGVLWPMFGPFLAVGLVEFVAELKLTPNLKVETYLHQHWPQLVEEINRQPPGTRILVVGYSLGANSTVFVANKTNYIDSIVALQPSMLSWNPNITGKVGKIIEVYNPDPTKTMGGMGSKRLVGDNIEYIANNDSHMGAQFSGQFRDIVRGEIARLNALDDPNSAITTASVPPETIPSPPDGSPQPGSPASVSAQPVTSEPLGPPPGNAFSGPQAMMPLDIHNVGAIRPAEPRKQADCGPDPAQAARSQNRDAMAQKILDSLCAH